MPGKARKVSLYTWSGSSPERKVSEHSVWLTRAVATRGARSACPASAAATSSRPAADGNIQASRRRVSARIRNECGADRFERRLGAHIADVGDHLRTCRTK